MPGPFMALPYFVSQKVRSRSKELLGELGQATDNLYQEKQSTLFSLRIQHHTVYNSLWAGNCYTKLSFLPGCDAVIMLFQGPAPSRPPCTQPHPPPTQPLTPLRGVPQIQGENQAARSAQYRGVLGTILTMVRTEGPRSPYKGLVAGLQRQMSFASVRIGLYDSVKQFYTPKGSDHCSITTRILAGCTTGAMAVTCAQPTDVVKIRFQASVHTGPGSNRKYSGTMDAYRTIAREEGVRGLWKGTLPNITRNAIINCAEMVTYDIIKEKLLNYHLLTDNFPCHFVSAFGAGFCATVVASPVDVVKTRYMNSPSGQYRSPFDCMLKMVTQEGPTAFYKG
ncbi:mitochondrial uncoupling protein 3 isoform X2 [Orcinus orca]|nr:mitochondrial uncoupling protein 3 isoform X2 [Orcinus orca]